MTDWKSAPPSRAPEPKPAAAPVQMFVRHHISTSHVEFTGPDTAEGRTYFAVYTPIGPDHAGVYTDRFRKTGDRWLISHRKVRTEWRAENSFFQQKRGDEQ
jgi:hypothetical protein